MEARRNAGKIMSGDAVAHALNPKHPFRATQYIRPGSRSARDHRRDNRRKIREIEQSFKQKQEDLEAARQKPQFRMRKFSNVEAKISTASSEGQGEKKHTFLKKGTGGSGSRPDPSSGWSRDPSSRRQRVKPKVPLHDDLEPMPTREKTNFVSRNVRQAIDSVPVSTEKPAPAPITENPGFGRVPLYIHKRKVELASKKEQKRLAKERERLPPGMKLMSEEERVRTVELLTKNQEKIVKQISELPLTIETPSMVEKNNLLHEKLQELEEALKLFSRKKVYITA